MLFIRRNIMGETSIIKEPYFIAICCALIFTFVVYLWLTMDKDNNKTNGKNSKNKNSKHTQTQIDKSEIPKKLLISFVGSLVAFFGIIYGGKYMSSSSGMKMMGGGSSNSSNSSRGGDIDISKLQMMGSDIDFGAM